MQARLSHASSLRQSRLAYFFRESLAEHAALSCVFLALSLATSCLHGDILFGELIMLRSTYKPAAPSPGPADTTLPPGWTVHKAPSGHSYYYNAATKQSTYTRPAPPSDEPLQIDYGATEPDHLTRASMQVMDEFHRNNANQPMPSPGHFTGGRGYQDQSRRRGNQGDRPKSKAAIPNCSPWVLVMTKFGRRFVHNTETKQSLWTFPQDVMMAVIEMDRLEWEAKRNVDDRKQDDAGLREGISDRASGDAARQPDLIPSRSIQEEAPDHHDSDSYEEVEVTDDEAGLEGDEQEPAKRPRLSDDQDEPPADRPVEFDEDDIAWQLAEMEGEAMFDDYDDQAHDHGEIDDDEGLPMTESDNIALFRALLDDSGISPFSTFEKLIEDDRVIEDPRYVALHTVSARKEAFSDWSKDRIAESQALKQQNSKQSKAPEPKVEYLRFLQDNATPKLYWPEFKRKYRKTPQMTDRKLQDKEREKLYRDLVAKLKLPESERKKDFVGVLKDAAKREKSSLRRNMQLDDLPESVLVDIRFYVLDERRKKELVGTFLDSL
jgi:hypothetical protein